MSSSLSGGAARTRNAGLLGMVASAGYAAKGVVYGVIGLLAVQAAWGSGGSTEGSRGAVVEIAQQPFGNVLLIVLAAGLVAYVLWRGAQALFDVEDRGTDAEGLTRRAAYLFSALSYASLAYIALQIVLGSGGGSGSGSKQTILAGIMETTLGRIAVGAAGLVVVAVGVYQAYRGWSGSFMKRYNTSKMDEHVRSVARRTGQIGMTSRGIVFVLIGIFLGRAALQADASESKGLGEALGTLAGQPYGPYLLGLVALGLIAYAVYCFTRARYGKQLRAAAG